MKEIIRRPLYFFCTCEKCATQFKYQKEDVEQQDKYSMYVSCPVCNKLNIHNSGRAIYKEKK